jgi:glycerol-3-phosphate dehydrogenase
MADFDLAIIGGGINGTGIARDAAGRGLRVLLVEQNDLASGTSSASTKLIHGGLRYLERRAFRLVHEALAEREVLLRMAPHVIRPLRFVLPPLPGQRSPLMLRIGLFIYDHLGGRKLLPATRTIDLTHHVVGQPMKRIFSYGFEFSDCAVDDSRLVVLTALDAAERGADIRTRTRLIRADRHDEEWDLVLNAGGKRQTASARVLVNAAGPWIGLVAETVLRLPLKAPARLIKGSHIVVRRRFSHDSGYVLQASDGRIVFALPFANDFTLIGTTDEIFVGDLTSPTPSPSEVIYLCEAVNQYFRDRVTPDELVWSYAGVRSLYDDGADKPEDVTRDYVLDLDAPLNGAPLLTVYGGKITTHRRLAEAALAQLSYFEARPPWTAESRLSGGDFAVDGFYAQVAEVLGRWPFLSEPHARRLVRAYGTRVERILGEAQSMHDLRPLFCGDLTGAEVNYLIENEWVRSAEDVLWRRSKLGLIATAEETAALQKFIVDLVGEPPR